MECNFQLIIQLGNTVSAPFGREDFITDNFTNVFNKVYNYKATSQIFVNKNSLNYKFLDTWVNFSDLNTKFSVIATLIEDFKKNIFVAYDAVVIKHVETNAGLYVTVQFSPFVEKFN